MRVEFELANYNIAVQYFSHYSTMTPQLRLPHCDQLCLHAQIFLIAMTQFEPVSIFPELDHVTRLSVRLSNRTQSKSMDNVSNNYDTNNHSGYLPRLELLL